MDLTYPNQDSTTFRKLLPRVLTQVVQEFLSFGPGQPGSLRHQVHDAARSALAKDAGTLAQTLFTPTCSAMLGAVARGESGAAFELDLLVAWELAAHMLLDEPIEATLEEGLWPTLLLPRQGVRVDIDSAVHTLRFSDRISLVSGTQESHIDADNPASDVPSGLKVSHAYVPITNDVSLALADNNPLTSVRGHPERDGNHLDLGGHDPAVWVECLQEALEIVETYLPELYEEMRWLLRVIVPVGFDEECQSSCSYQDTVGAIYLTLHPKALKLAEAIVHEYQHNKLYAVLRLDPILKNAKTSRHRSPVRPDARPLEGLLLAVHAFLPVDLMYQRITTAAHAWSKSRDWENTCQNATSTHIDGAKVLYIHGQPTKLGAMLFTEMQTLAGNLARKGPL